MDIKYAKSNGSFIISLDGELDEYSAGGAKDILDRLILDNINA